MTLEFNDNDGVVKDETGKIIGKIINLPQIEQNMLNAKNIKFYDAGLISMETTMNHYDRRTWQEVLLPHRDYDLGI